MTKPATAVKHPRVSDAPPQPPPASTVAADLVAVEDKLARITPEWTLVLKKRPGGGKAKPVDYPRASLTKGGHLVLLNDHAARLLAGMGGTAMPPAELRRAEKGDDQAFTLGRRKNMVSPTWGVVLRTTAIEKEAAPTTRVHRRMRSFGSGIWGFHFGAEAQG